MSVTKQISPSVVKHNKLRAILVYTFRTAALLCATGPLMQTFLSGIGFSDGQIYTHATLFQAVNVVMILLCARFADTPKVLLRTALIQLPGALLFLGYVPLCLAQNAAAESYLWLLLISILQSAVFALHTVCEYKIPYYIYHPHEYGTVLAICGIISSLVSFGAGSVMSVLSTRYSYTMLMTGAFLISCVFLLIAGTLQLFQKSLISLTDTDMAEEKDKIPLRQVFRHRAFSYLLVGNITRGFANGATTILAAAALSIGYDEVLTTSMVSVQSIASLLSCFLFSLIAGHINPRYVILGGSLCFLIFPVLMIPDKPILFLIFFAVLFFGKTLVDYAIPAALLYMVPVEIAGTYNAWRMILFNGGTMLGTIAAGFLPLPALFCTALLCQLITGCNYFYFQPEKQQKTQDNSPHLIGRSKIMNQRKIIMDTDIGSDIDDALCLAYLLKQPSCDLVGITTCSSEPEKRAELADSICRYMGSEIPIYPGRDTPLIGKQLQVAVHQYEAAKPFPHRSVFPTHRAIDFMREIIEAHPHQITLLAIGPLTNIGALLSAYPHLAPLIPEISVMGGSFFEEAVSFIPIEWNIKNDPTAARIVFDSGIPTRVVGLDVTLKLKIQCTDFIGMSHSDNLKPVIKNAQKFLDRTNDMYFHDPLAAVCLFDESVCTFQRGQITVGIGRDDWGRTCFEETPSGSVCVAVDVDQDQFYRHYFGMIGSGNETM